MLSVKLQRVAYMGIMFVTVLLVTQYTQQSRDELPVEPIAMLPWSFSRYSVRTSDFAAV